MLHLVTRAGLLGLLAAANAASLAQTTAEKADPIYAVADDMPTFPGGQPALLAYLTESLEFPAEALEAPIDGAVQVSFIVRKDGRITDATVVKGQHPALDAEALRLVSEMPEWEPGRQQGKVVSTLCNLPIRFIAPPPHLVQAPSR
jgi:TonB family protein